MSYSFKAIICDMDGLLIDSERRAVNIWHRVSTELGYEFDEEFFHQFIGLRHDVSEKKLTEVFNCPDEAKHLQQQYITAYYEKLKTRPIPAKSGAQALLEYLDSKEIPWGIATGTHRENALLKLKKAELYRPSIHLVAGDEVTHGKPHPEVFLTMASRLNVAPEECIVLEDSEAGLRAALRGGLTAIHIPDLCEIPEDLKDRVHHTFDSLDDFLVALETLFKLELS